MIASTENVIVLYCRQEKESELFRSEQKHGFHGVDWGPDTVVYRDTLTTAVTKRRELLMQKMHQVAFDRKDLVNIMRRYGSKSISFVIAIFIRGALNKFCKLRIQD